MTAVTTEPIVREVEIAAAPETVFGFFTDPEKLTRWLCESAVSDPRPGGVLEQVHVTGDGRRLTMRGEFVEVDYPSRVVFSWGYEDGVDTPPASSTVEVVFERVAVGTLLRLTHSGLNEPARVAHDDGWKALLGDLASAAAST